MYTALASLAPEWLATHGHRRGMGVGFLCPEHENCHIRVWFLNPLDGGQPITRGPGLELRARRGDTFEALEVEGTIVHGAVFLHIHDGVVASS